MIKRLTGKVALAAMAFAAGTMIAAQAAAEIHFEAAVNTPDISVRVGYTPDGCAIIHNVRPLPARGVIYRTIPYDLEIARRLAWYTGVPVGELLRHRRCDYTWFEIGRWLYVPERVVRAALDQQHWNRFLYAGGYMAEYRGGHGRDGHRHDYDRAKNFAHRGHGKKR